jgi:hypothetical protein
MQNMLHEWNDDDDDDDDLFGTKLAREETT